MESGRATISGAFSTTSSPDKSKLPLIPSQTGMAPLDPHGFLPTGNSTFPSSISSHPFYLNTRYAIPHPPIFNSLSPSLLNSLYSTPAENHAFIDLKRSAASPLTGVWPRQDPRRVHTCTICNRGFPSHQSLAGHRSSHARLSSLDNMAPGKVGNKVPGPPHNLKIANNLAVANSPSASIVSAPRIGDCASSTPHASSAKSYLLGIKNEKIMEGGHLNDVNRIRGGVFPLKIKTVKREVAPENEAIVQNKGQPPSLRIFRTQLPLGNEITKEKRQRAVNEKKEKGYISDESVTSKRRLMKEAELDLSLRL